MSISSPITALFLDIGGVLLTNGWDSDSRRHTAEKFNLDFEEMNERHHLTFDTYEIALDIAQVRPEQVVYIDDRVMFVEIARELGINGIIHTSNRATRISLEGFGLNLYP